MKLQVADAAKRSEDVFQQTTAILDIVAGTPDAIANLRSLISLNSERQAIQGELLKKSLVNISDHLGSISLQSKRSFEIVRQGGANINRAMTRLYSLLQEIRKLVQAYVS